MSEAPIPASAPPAPVAAQHPPDLMHDAVGPSPELSRKNARLSIGLVILALVLFAGTFAVGASYLHFT
jgi:hypothetical protein